MREMHRVLKPGGRLHISTPMPNAFFDVLDREIAHHVSAEASGFVHAVFSLNDPQEMRRLLADAGFEAPEVHPHRKRLELPPARDFLWQYISCTPLMPTLERPGLVKRTVRGRIHYVPHRSPPARARRRLAPRLRTPLGYAHRAPRRAAAPSRQRPFRPRVRPPCRPPPRHASSDRIEKQVTLDVPRSRVWRALTDVAQFNTWFGVSLSDAVRARRRGQREDHASANYEHVTMTIWIETMEPERFFSFRWHPYAIEPGRRLLRRADDARVVHARGCRRRARGSRSSSRASSRDAAVPKCTAA